MLADVLVATEVTPSPALRLPGRSVPLRLYGMTRRDVTAVWVALDQLRRYRPWDFEAIARKILAVRYAPHLCEYPGALACAGTAAGPRVIVLSVRPSHQSVVELAVVLRHEAQHVVELPDGRIGIQRHVCSDPGCSDPVERASDPIYADDDEARREILRGEHHDYLLRLAGVYA